MKNQVEILRERIEKIDEYNHGVISEVIQDILNIVPEKETESVKAYRALIILVEYLDETDIDTGMFAGEFTITEQLYRIRGEIEKEATEDVKSRLEIDETEVSFDSRISEEEITDPVSKATATIAHADPRGAQTEMRKEHLAVRIANGDI
jgi:hypothetical protein